MDSREGLNQSEWLEIFKLVSQFTTKIQAEIGAALIKGGGSSIESLKKLPESKQLELLDEAISKFVQAIPLANEVRVNLFTSALSHHSVITGEDFIEKLIEINNNEIINQNDTG